jgi:glucuronate isomerase
MSTPFIHDDFLLHSEPARRLYHDYAAAQPILDYHCHLPPAEIADDHRFANLTQIWLAGDHYKWRAMRANGVDERFCTGDATDREKFDRWAATVPRCLRNPLYHWTHLELNRPFGIRELLGPDTAAAIWERCNALLATPEFSTRGILAQMKVAVVCTTDDPVDDLEHHRRLAATPGVTLRMLPTWRPDRGMAIEDPAAFNAWVDRLAAAADVEVRDFASYLRALQVRHDAFAAAGCRLSDHGLETAYGADYTDADVARTFAELRAGRAVDPAASDRFKSAMMYEFGVMDHAAGWVQQLHLGALRNNNTRMLQRLGPDTGFDSMGDWPVAAQLARYLDRLDQQDRLPRTIVYNNNPRDNAVLATMIGNFQDGSVAGKMQFGSAWWHLDQWDGMRQQLADLSNMGLLSRFVGMLTDSRSFLSFTRHEYFRRLLCDLLGDDIERGVVPRDFDLVGGLVADVSYHNAARYFAFDA